MNEEMKKAVENAQVVFNALNQQRKGGIAKLEERIKNLQDSGINVENFENPKLVDALREVTQSLNSVLLTLTSHDKLIDTLLNEVIKMSPVAESGAEGAMQASFAIETIGNILMNKEMITREEIETEQKKAQARIQKLREEHQKAQAEAQQQVKLD